MRFVSQIARLTFLLTIVVLAPYAIATVHATMK